MFYDLNVPWTMKDDPELSRTVAFLAELGYNVIALNQTISGKIPSKAANVANLIPENPFPDQPSIRFLRRVTVILDDPSQNYGLTSLSSSYDIVAIRPTNEKLLQQACASLDCDLISLDLSIRHPYHFKHKVLCQALARGIRFEITYSASIHDSNSRRNLLSNAAALIRASKGKGIIITSEARLAALCRAPFDVINLATLWGLNQEKGKEAIANGSRSVVLQAKMRRQSFRGVIDVVDGGGVPKTATTERTSKTTISQKAQGKRKADLEDPSPLPPAAEGAIPDSTPAGTENMEIEPQPVEAEVESRPTKKQRKKEKQAAKKVADLARRLTTPSTL